MPANMLCLPVMPVQRIPYGGRYHLRAVRISTVSLSGNWRCRASSRLLIYGLNFCLPHLSVKEHVTLHSLKQKKRTLTCTRYFLHVLLNAITHCLLSVRQSIWVHICTPSSSWTGASLGGQSPEGGLLLPAKKPAQPPADISYRYFTGCH